jgi:ribosomal protein S18 acetylase RimI-like enzyme
MRITHQGFTENDQTQSPENPAGNPDNGCRHMPVMPEYSCDLLTIPDTVNAARLYQEVFLADEPTTHIHAPDPALFLPDALRYIRYLAEDNLSFVARDTSTDDLIGFIFCFDMTVDLDGQGAWMKKYLGHFPDAVAMIDTLEDHYLDRKGLVSGSALHIFQIGVSRKYRGCGIAGCLIRTAIAHARERGFCKAVADCTSAASRRTFERCGFSPSGFLSYGDFSRNGIRFFSGLEGGITLMLKDL